MFLLDDVTPNWSCEMPKEKPYERQEILFATAGVPNEQLDIFTEEALRGIAAEDSRCRYDEQNKQLWVTLLVLPNAVEQMFNAVAPDVEFVDVTPDCSCKSDCPRIGCKGGCGCRACSEAYADFLSLE